MNKAEELIACLEGEIAKRDEELAACHISVENCELFRARIAELEGWKAQEMQVMSPLMDYARGLCTGPLGCSLTDWLVQDHKQLRAELAAVKARGVVMPELEFQSAADEAFRAWEKAGDRIPDAIAYMAARDGFREGGAWQARLNAAPVQQVSVPDGWKLVPDHSDADAIVTALYRRFKDWARQGFGPEDVTWCEVRADILAMLATQAADAVVVPRDLLMRVLEPVTCEQYLNATHELWSLIDASISAKGAV